jgi:hypothetical protein
MNNNHESRNGHSTVNGSGPRRARVRSLRPTRSSFSAEIVFTPDVSEVDPASEASVPVGLEPLPDPAPAASEPIVDEHQTGALAPPAAAPNAATKGLATPPAPAAPPPPASMAPPPPAPAAPPPPASMAPPLPGPAPAPPEDDGVTHWCSIVFERGAHGGQFQAVESRAGGRRDVIASSHSFAVPVSYRTSVRRQLPNHGRARRAHDALVKQLVGSGWRQMQTRGRWHDSAFARSAAARASEPPQRGG